MDYRTRTFIIDGATITVREGIGIDIIDAPIIYAQMSYDNKRTRDLNRARRFVNALLRSSVDGDLGFPWADSDSDGDVIQTAYEGWKQLPPATMATWENELRQVNEVVADPNDSRSTSESKSSPELTVSSSESTTTANE